MSKTRQLANPDPEAGILVRNWATTHPHGAEIRERALEWHQLAYASRGVITVRTPDGIWVVPPHRGVWIPAGTVHHVAMAPGTSVRTLYFARRSGVRVSSVCRAVNVPALLRELLLEVCRVGVLHRRIASERRLAGVVVDQLQLLETEPLELPWPTDPRARHAAELLREEPGAANLMRKVERTVGASRRTLERCFVKETRLSLWRWKQRARLVAALELLASGRAVTSIALDVGYSSPSAFITAFRRELGCTPGEYFASGLPILDRPRRRASNR